MDTKAINCNFIESDFLTTPWKHIVGVKKSCLIETVLLSTRELLSCFFTLKFNGFDLC